MTGPIEDEFTVNEAEVRAGRQLPRPHDLEAALRDRELTFLIGLALLAIGAGLFVAAAWGLGAQGAIAGLGAALVVPGSIVTLIALWARAGRAS